MRVSMSPKAEELLRLAREKGLRVVVGRDYVDVGGLVVKRVREYRCAWYSEKRIYSVYVYVVGKRRFRRLWEAVRFAVLAKLRELVWHARR